MEKLKLAFEKVLTFVRERTLLVVCVVVAFVVLIAMAVAANNSRTESVTISPTPMVRLVSTEPLNSDSSSLDASLDVQDSSARE